MTAGVSIQNVTKVFGDFTALQNVSLDIKAGEFIVLLGPSGCGKTTLLSILGGFISPTSGKVLLDGQDMTMVAPSQRPTTTMFQDYALFPHMTLRDNVGFGLRMRGMARAARQAIADDLLSTVGLEGMALRKPHELSGGQRQRVALARALAVEPQVLLLDEPLGALDLKLRRQMQDELKVIQKRVGTTFIHVTHDQEEAMAIADRIVVINQGRVEDFGEPSDVYMRPKSIFSADFMGEVNFLAATLAHVEHEVATLKTAFGDMKLAKTAFPSGTPDIGQKLTICVRPEQLLAGPGSGGRVSLGKMQICDIAFFGTHFRCHLVSDLLPGQPIIAHFPQGSGRHSGELVDMTIDTTEIVALPSATVNIK